MRAIAPPGPGGEDEHTKKCRVATLACEAGWWIKKRDCLIHHPGASRHPSCPGGAIARTTLIVGDKRSQQPVAAGMPQLPQRLGFNLADTLAGDPESLT